MQKSLKSNSVGIWASLKTLICLKLPSFSPKVFLKLLSGARPFFTLHSYFRQENIYLMQGAMQCMILHEWNGWVFKFVFHLNSFYSPFLDLLFVLPVCSVRTCFLSLLCFCPLLRQIFCLDDSLSHHNFPMLGVWMLWFIDSFLIGKQIDFSFSCWILFLTSALSVNSKQIMKTYQSNALILFM